MITTPAAGAAGVFNQTVATMNDGEVIADLDDALREAVTAAEATGKKTKVTLTLTIIPKGEGVGGTPLFAVDDDIKVTKPKRTRKKSSVFFSDAGNLTRRNPNQEDLQLKSIDGGKIGRDQLPGGAQTSTGTGGK